MYRLSTTNYLVIRMDVATGTQWGPKLGDGKGLPEGWESKSQKRQAQVRCRERLRHSETIREELCHVATAVENGNDLQRRCFGPVDDQIRIDREELHRFLRQILAPVSGTRACG